jgi:hypothetical protein
MTLIESGRNPHGLPSDDPAVDLAIDANMQPAPSR